MRMTFDSKTSMAEQLIRAAKRKQVGRKHHKQPSSRKVERQKAGRRKWAEYLTEKARAFKDNVREYWAGSREGYPK